MHWTAPKHPYKLQKNTTQGNPSMRHSTVHYRGSSSGLVYNSYIPKVNPVAVGRCPAVVWAMSRGAFGVYFDSWPLTFLHAMSYGRGNEQARLNLRCWAFWKTHGVTSPSPNSLLVEFLMQPGVSAFGVAGYVRVLSSFVSFHFQVSPKLWWVSFVSLCLPLSPLFSPFICLLAPVPLSFFCLPLPPCCFVLPFIEFVFCSDCRCPSDLN